MDQLFSRISCERPEAFTSDPRAQLGHSRHTFCSLCVFVCRTNDLLLKLFTKHFNTKQACINYKPTFVIHTCQTTAILFFHALVVLCQRAEKYLFFYLIIKIITLDFKYCEVHLLSHHITCSNSNAELSMHQTDI